MHKFLHAHASLGARITLVAALLLLPAITRDVGGQTGNGPTPSTAEIRIDTQVVKHTMAGGAGASWHAMGPEAYWYQDLITGKLNRNSRGSGWGGNPPLEYTEAWSDLSRHARWLGLDFIRVEIDMRMYEPERGKFDWQNDQMQTLYRILDHCQRNDVDVFFTQMWADVKWNEFPGAGRLQSAPKSVDDFAQGLATLMEHLVKTKHYTCIRWLCIVNEPGYEWSWWQGPDGKAVSLMPALHAVRAELDKRGVAVGLSAPDWSSMGQNTTEFDFADPVVAAFDAHNYAYFPNTPLQKLWADKAHARGIPFFQSEFGDWGGDNPFNNHESVTPKSYSNQLVNAEKVIQGMNVGVDGFNRWSFTNRGDLDGQWQLVRTFDVNDWQYLRRVEPEPVPYYSYGIITRFLAKHSSVLESKCDGPDLVATASRSPRGNMTILILNKSEGDQPINLFLANLERSTTLYKYQVTEGSMEKPGFELNPLDTREVSTAKPAFTDVLPDLSITVYTTYKLMHADPGITGDE
ncbi:MAG TPA: hypothetical protein VMO17_09260 [Terriglobia bacterium]|nr:hypothetical protein [Terriglobia bacterium]